MWFKRKNNNLGEKSFNTEEYVKLLKRISELDTRLETIDNKYGILKTDVENLRGRFNQKLKSFTEEKPNAETKDLNLDNTVYL